MKMIVERRRDLFLAALSIVCFLLFVCISDNGAEARLSGVYGDNGHDQTIIHHTLTNNDQREVEHEILELLGLPERPRRNMDPSLRRAVPKFLLEVYRRSLAEDGDQAAQNGGRHTRSTGDGGGDQLITALDREVIEQSDIIMTFLNKNHHVADVRHERGSRVWFDTSEVSPELTLMMGELRLYQRQVDVLNVSRHGGWSGHSHHLNVDKDGTVFTISVYAQSWHRDASGEEHKELELLGTLNTTTEHVGWLEMNITGTLGQWIGDTAHNHGLYIAVRSVNRPEHEIRLEELGLVARAGVADDDDQLQPFVVGFFKGPDIIHPTKSQQRAAAAAAHHHRRTKRNAVTPQGKRRKAPPAETQRTHPFFEQRPADAQSCQIQQLYVSFKDLKWHDWIIAPDGYGAYYCSGECNFPMNSHMNATNHAIVQTLVHLLHPLKVPKPCCAPTKLSPISVLYFIDETNVMLKRYKNMVVKSCGCH